MLLAVLAASAQDLCRNGIFADDQAGLRLAREGATEVIVSKVSNGRACVWENHDKVDWVPVAGLDLNVPFDRNPPLAAWVGDWKFFDNHLKISVTPDGKRLHVDGSAFWHGVNSEHSGKAEDEAAPTANRLLLNVDTCQMSVTLLNQHLVATDNRKCGGMNVTFSGVYELAREPFDAQSASTLKYGRNSDGQDTVDISNVTWELNHRLILRKTHTEKNVIDDMGNDPKITVEAWPLGVNPRQKPLYAVTLDGQDAAVVDDALLVIDRTQETPWWSVYHLDSGQPFFNTYAPLLRFSITDAVQTERYAGLEIPEGEAGKTIGTLYYASDDRVIRKVRITGDSAQKAAELRSFAEGRFELDYVSKAIRITLTATVITIPVTNDNLDLMRARVPVGLHLQ